MSMSTIVDAVWQGETLPARVARGLLAPAARAFGAVVARRNAYYDSATMSVAALPALSVGNLTVGGTGKTPFAAWCVQQLRARGARPSIVMRGVGDDEWRVHGVLNPNVPVIVSPDRGAGMLVARTRGADCAVLDDAFQHRRASRIGDLVLVSADRWAGAARLLPAGPFREPLSALRRAHVVVITVKAAASARVDDVMAAVRAAAPNVPMAVVRLQPGPLRLAVTVGASSGHGGPQSGMLTHSPEWLAGRDVSIVSAIGDPAAFESQLRDLGAVPGKAWRFPDHHDYSAGDAAQIAAGAAGTSGVVCTLKDAVKLAACWPREAPPLWYLSQSVVVDRGAEALDQVLARLLAARATTTFTAG
ncbi:MAG: tetraacyldisaccharide 4'-kinase [Gemmatimonadaceae bacterium]|nr:tetraacyldisaccharide 4'-kinase [Gemmatimonadaceae bacterium]